MAEKVDVFVSYAYQDKKLHDRLIEHLALLKQQEIISTWSDCDIYAGGERQQIIHDYLNAAQIILLLVSPAFLSSSHCYSEEMKQAMERHAAGEAHVIPILLRPVDWHQTPFGKLQSLPSDARPVTKWRDRDEAFLDIAQGIRRSAEAIRANSSTKGEVPQIGSNQKVSGNSEAASFYRSISIGTERKFIIALKNPTEQQELKAIEEQAQELDITFTADKDFIELRGKDWRSGRANTPEGRSGALRDLAKLAHNIIVRLNKNDTIIINPQAYQTFQALLDTIYLEYLTDQYQPYSYGTDWILAQDNDFHFVYIQQVAVPWDWLLHPQQRTLVQGFRSPPQACGMEGGTYWKLLNVIPESLFGVATNNPLVASCFTYRDSVKQLWNLMHILANAERSKITEGRISAANKPWTPRNRDRVSVNICVESVPPENVDVNAHQSLIIFSPTEDELDFPRPQNKNTAFVVTDLEQNYKHVWLRRCGLLVTVRVDECRYGYSTEEARPYSCWAYTLPSPGLPEEHLLSVESARPYAAGELLRVWINPADPSFNELEDPVSGKAER